MCGLFQEPTTQRYSFLGQEGRSSVCLGQAVEDPYLVKRGGRQVGPSVFPPFLRELDRGSAGEPCCCDSPRDAASTSPFLATSGSEDTVHAKPG